MVTEYGMSDKLGPRSFGHKEELVFLGREISEQRDYSDKIAEQIDDEVHSIILNAYEVAKKILTENKDKLTRTSEALLERETLESGELEALFSESAPLPLPEATATPAPTPVRAATKTKTKPAPKKAPAIPQLLPKQTPATPD